jgi:hypothetical protein
MLLGGRGGAEALCACVAFKKTKEMCLSRVGERAVFTSCLFTKYVGGLSSRGVGLFTTGQGKEVKGTVRGVGGVPYCEGVLYEIKKVVLCIRNDLCFGTRKKADIKKNFGSRIRDPGWRKI